MHARHWFGSLIALACAALCVASSAVAQDGQKWEWKAFSPGSEYYQELKTATEQTITVMGQPVKQTQAQTFYLKYTGQKPQDGKLVVQQKIIGVKMQIDIGDTRIAYDSFADKQASNPMTDFFQALLEAEIKMHIDPARMAITKIEGHNELVQKLSHAKPEMQPLLQTILSEDALKQMAEPTWRAFPTEAKQRGDSWTSKSTLKLGPIGDYVTEYVYTLEAPVEAGEKIKIDAQMTYSPPKDKSGLAFQIKSASLKSKEGTGHAIFDKTKGRIESSEMTMKLEGTLEIEVGGMTTTVELSQAQTATVRCLDADPRQAKK